MFDNLSFGECIGTVLGCGILLRFGSLLADGFLDNVKWLLHKLKLHFQVQKRKTDYQSFFRSFSSLSISSMVSWAR